MRSERDLDNGGFERCAGERGSGLLSATLPSFCSRRRCGCPGSSIGPLGEGDWLGELGGASAIIDRVDMFVSHGIDRSRSKIEQSVGIIPYSPSNRA